MEAMSGFAAASVLRLQRGVVALIVGQKTTSTLASGLRFMYSSATPLEGRLIGLAKAMMVSAAAPAPVRRRSRSRPPARPAPRQRRPPTLTMALLPPPTTRRKSR